MFNNLKIPQEGVVKETDYLGSKPLESGLYRAVIKQAYGTQSQGGAKGLVVKFEIAKSDGSKHNHTETFWVTNKQGSVTYKDKEGKDHYLMGFNQANTICIAAAGKQISQCQTETRILPVWSFQDRADVPTEVQALPELFEQELALGILKVKQNKQAKDQSGNYVDTNESITLNQIDKIFILKDGQPLTMNEYEAGLNQGKFAAEWVEKNKNQTRDKYKPVSGASNSTGSTTPLDIG